jgi:sodium/proline symporter
MIEKYSVISLYFIVLLVLGFVASRGVRDMKGFVAGGKSLSFWVAAFSAQATGESAWLLLGVTGMGAMLGFSAFWIVIGEVVGVFFAWFVMGKRFKRLTDRYASLTMTDFLVSRFGSTTHTLRILSAVSLIVFVLIYISAQIDATGSAFEAFLGWPYMQGALVGFGIVVVYCVAGGFLAAAWTDMFQGAVMLGCLVVLPIVAFLAIGDWGVIHAGLEAIDPGLVSVWGSGGVNWMNLATVLGMMLIGLGFLGSPQVFARLLSIRSEAEIDRGKWVAVLFTFLVDAAAVSVGVLGRYVFTSEGVDPEAVLGNGAQNVMSQLVQVSFPPWIVGLYVAAVLSAIMSTVSSLLVMAASAVTHDLYAQFTSRSLSDRFAALLCRYATLCIACGAMALAIAVALLSPDRTIFWFAIFGWSGIAATFCPMVILALFWSGFTERGAIASMLGGFSMTMLSKFVLQDLAGVGPLFQALETMPPSFLFALVLGYLVSLAAPDKPLKQRFLSECHAELPDL